MSRAQVDQSRGGLIEEAEEERRRILGAMILFDSEQRERYWRGWEQGRTESYAIRQRGRLYPARHMLSLAVERLRLKSMAIGVAFLRGLGFEIVALPQPVERPALTPRQTKPRGKRLSTKVLDPLQLTLAPAQPPARHYRTERDFEQRVIAPVIEAWGCKSRTQVTRLVYRGKQRVSGRIDFVIHRPQSRAVLTVLEAKREIRSVPQLYHAAYQAESYARALRLPHFVIAAPEGCWIFSRSRRSFAQVEVFGANVWDGGTLALRSRLFALAGHSARA